MATGYTRQHAADIATGEVIEAAHHNDEYNAIQSAMNSSTGHNHDGTTGGGAKIPMTTGVTGILPIANGGTAGSTASAARTALGLAIGTDVQAFSTRLNEVAALAPTADNFIVGSGAAWTLKTPSQARTSLGLSTMALQSSSGVNITGGTISGLTSLGTAALTATGAVILGAAGHDWPAADGTANQVLSTDGSGNLSWRTVGISNTDELIKVSSNDTAGGYLNGKLVAGANITLTENNNGSNETLSVAWSAPANLGAINALAVTDNNIIVGNGTTWVAESGSTARASLGVAIGSDVQAWSTHLDAVAALSKTDGNFIVTNGTTFVAESGATARTSLGLGSLATLSTVNDSNWSGTDLAIVNGGTGASSAAAALTNLGAAANSITITAGTGLTGGGDLSANRTINLSVSSLSESATTPKMVSGDFFAIHDASIPGSANVNFNDVLGYALLKHEETSGTNGGTFTSGAWQTRPLNIEEFDSGAFVTLSANQFTLPAGRYRIRANATTNRVNQSQLRLQNITDTTTACLGIHGGSNGGSTDPAQSIDTLCGVFTITASKTFELQHRGTTTRATDGFGVARSWGTEVYAVVEIFKIG